MASVAVKNPDTNRTFLSRACRFLGEKRQEKLVILGAACLRNPSPLTFPSDIAAARRVAIMLPEATFEAFYHSTTVFALVQLFARAEIVIICERQIAGFFDHVEGIHSIVTYDKDGRYLFSRELISLASILSQKPFDVCVMLERRPDISLVHLMSRLAPRIRIGYDGRWGYPFLNVRFGVQGIHTHIADQNMSFAKMLGAPTTTARKWSVSKQSTEEIRHMLHEYRIGESAVLGGIDAGYFYRCFGAAWTTALIESLVQLPGYTWYVCNDGIADEELMGWLESRNLAVFSAQSPSRTAALVHLSSVVISGRSLYYGLALVLAKSSIGVFETTEVQHYSRPSATAKTIVYSGMPDSQTIGQIQLAVHRPAVSAISRTNPKT